MGPLGHSLSALSAIVAAPVALVALGLHPRWRVGLKERFGARPASSRGAVWVHGASVGEVQAASRLLDALRKQDERVVASAMTVTGRDLLRQMRPEIPCALAPFDHPWTTERALRNACPSALVLIETELWPSWIQSAHRINTPVIVASGRISDRSYDRYRKAPTFFRSFFKTIASVGARSDVDADRFCGLGVRPDRVRITGDLKFSAPEELPSLAPELAQQFGSLPLIVAGSTHDGEEVALLDAFDFVEASGCRAALVLAPRHPDRFDGVAELVSGRGRNLIRRTFSKRPLVEGDVLLLDSLGELPAVFGRADVAFVGGSLAHQGGHNILEPVYFGRAAIFGPYTDHIREPVRLLLNSGAGVQIDTREELARVLCSALSDQSAWIARGKAGLEILRLHSKSAELTANLVLETRESEK